MYIYAPQTIDNNEKQNEPLCIVHKTTIFYIYILCTVYAIANRI